MAFYGISAKNEEQKLAFQHLTNDKPFTFITGPSGCGKSLVSQAVGMEKVMEERAFRKLIYTRLQIEVGVPQGFLPGDEQTKLYPFIAPFMDNLEVMDTDDNIRNYIMLEGSSEERKKIFFDSIQSIRGRSLNNVYFIIDESQNLDINTISAIATRAGFNSKFIFLGNFAQCDDKNLRTPETNGFYKLLSGLYEKDPHQKYFDHINFTDVQRHPVVGLVEDILRNHDMDERFSELEKLGNIENYQKIYGMIQKAV